MIYIFFIYGLSFFVMGTAILIYPKTKSQYKFANNIWLIGAFAIFHGITEWIEMLIQIEPNQLPYLQTVSLVFLSFSFLFLLCFGLRMLDQKYEKYPLPYLLPILIIFPIVITIFVSQSENIFLNANIFIRYFIGFPAIILTTEAFYIRLDKLTQYKRKRLDNALKLLISSLFFYAFAAGLIVPDAQFFPASFFNYSNFHETFGFPIQLLRTILAVTMTYATIEVLKIFRYEAEIKLEKLASMDNLTGIFNRMKFDEHLDQETARAQRYHNPLSLVLLDIDYFKRVNDTYGHLEGDRVLKIIANIIKRNIRVNDIYARWGGEEFVILMPDTNQQEAVVFADRLRIEIEKFDFDNVGHITASFGVTQYQRDESIIALMKRVDDTLYEAKEAGRNRVLCA